MRSAIDIAAGEVGIGADDDELVAADAADDVARPDPQAQTIRELPQHVVTGRVPEPIIDGFERVDVQEQHRQRTAGTFGCRDRGFEALLKQLPIGEPGELIVKREVLEPALQADADERLGGLATQRALQVEELIVEVAATGEEAHQDAEPILPVDERHDAQRLQARLSQPRGEQRKLRFDLIGVHDDERRGVAQRVDRRNVGERVGAGDELQLPGIIQEQHRALGRRERVASEDREGFRDILISWH